MVLTLHSIWGIKQVVYNLGNARGRTCGHTVSFVTRSPCFANRHDVSRVSRHADCLHAPPV